VGEIEIYKQIKSASELNPQVGEKKKLGENDTFEKGSG